MQLPSKLIFVHSKTMQLNYAIAIKANIYTFQTMQLPSKLIFMHSKLCNYHQS